MANKKLKVGGSENLKLPEKKDKTAKKPKWQAKIGGRKGGEKVEPVVETPVTEVPQVVVPGVVADEPTVPAVPTETPEVATTPEVGGVEATTTHDGATTPDIETPAEVPITTQPEAPTTSDKPTAPKKPRKLKVKADAPPKKLSMMAAVLQVLQQRKVAMTCPELIDLMATEDLWTSPGGKTPANTLYAAISRDIKVNGTGSAFRKVERGKFEAV
jgi:hypothetical protein